MKYLPSCLALLLGTALIGFGIHITKDANCLWALILVGIMSIELYPDKTCF